MIGHPKLPFVGKIMDGWMIKKFLSFFKIIILLVRMYCILQYPLNANLWSRFSRAKSAAALFPFLYIHDCCEILLGYIMHLQTDSTASHRVMFISF